MKGIQEKNFFSVLYVDCAFTFVFRVFFHPHVILIIYLGLSSSDSDEELTSPSYASFLHGDRKPTYSDVVWKQMVCEHGKKKKSEFPTGIEPMTLHTLVGCSNH